MFHGCLKDLSREFQGSFKKVFFHGRLRGVSRAPYSLLIPDVSVRFEFFYTCIEMYVQLAKGRPHN